jgi:hypothetical protein
LVIDPESDFLNGRFQLIDTDEPGRCSDRQANDQGQRPLAPGCRLDRADACPVAGLGGPPLDGFSDSESISKFEVFSDQTRHAPRSCRGSLNFRLLRSRTAMPQWATADRTMSRNAAVAAFLMLSSALLGQAPSIRTLPELRDVTSIEAAVKAAYQREFGRTVDHPAIYNNPQANNCRGEGHLTTTAYLRTGTTTTVFSMYMSRDAATVTRKTQSVVPLVPAGTIRVLVLLLRYPQTVAANALTLWESAQKGINEDHAVFAKSRGYNAPIVVFDNTNILMDPARVANPRRPNSVRMAAEREGVSIANYQIVMAIDINPQESVGGYSVPEERAVYVGNYSSWKTLLGAPEWKMIARTAYHHEIAHHWGLASTHDWAGSCSGSKQDYAPFIAPPVLFGWEDLDGDHVPEILSTTPYGSH